MSVFRWRAVLAAVGLVALTHLAAVPAAAADSVISGTILTDNGVALPNACAEAAYTEDEPFQLGWPPYVVSSAAGHLVPNDPGG